MNGTGIEDRLRGKGYAGPLTRGEPLASYTSFGIGGPADLLVTVRDTGDLVSLLSCAHQAAIPVRVIGGGTNILVADGGVRGLVVVNRCRGYHVDDNGLLVAEAGALMAHVARQVSRDGSAGLAWAAGIPGTIGGAVVGNAGAYGGSVSDNLVWADVVARDGSHERLKAAQLEYGYRASVLKSDPACGMSRIVVRAAFQMGGGSPDDLEAEMTTVLAQRSVRIPPGKSAGSVFKRTLHYPAGFLIEQAGLKGHRIGDAQVSRQHANFFLNVGHARAADMKALVDLAQEKVWEMFGERLELEIQFVGEWN